MASPNRPACGKPTPLARVAEETSLPELEIPSGKPAEKLVEVETPRPSGEDNPTPRLNALTNGTSAESAASTSAHHETPKANGKPTAVTEEAMKTIEI